MIVAMKTKEKPKCERHRWDAGMVCYICGIRQGDYMLERMRAANSKLVRPVVNDEYTLQEI